MTVISRRLVMTTVLLGLVATVAVAQVQQLPQRPQVRPVPQVHTGMEGYYERQLAQIDQLIRLGYFSRAYALLEEQARAGAPENMVLGRRIRIALGVGDNEKAVELCNAALAAEPADPGLLRQLATALAALGRADEAREVLDRYLALVDEPKGGFATAVDILRTAGDDVGAVALVDSARVVLGLPTFLASPRALSLLRLDESEAAALEIRSDLAASPFNLQLLRKDLLGADAPPLPEDFDRALRDLASDDGAGFGIALLAANIELSRGRSEPALALVEPHLDEAVAARAVLHNADTLVRELPLVTTRQEQLAMTDYLLAVLPPVAVMSGLPVRLHQRALDGLAETCVYALENGLLDDEPEAAGARFAELLELVRRGHPESEHLYAAQIQLARFSRDQLGDPGGAAARLEHLLLDLDLPLEGVALARLALGESYLAARDTVRARQVLTALGRDIDFRGPAGHAHFMLAKLDLAEGHFATARDRFAAVALGNPAAPYANDALELGLVVAEELQNPTGGPDLLRRYSYAVWFEIVAEPDSQRIALMDYIDRASLQVDLGEKQALLERARFELALLERGAGRYDGALEQLERIISDHPAGRLAPRALALRGEIFTNDRNDAAAARRQYERLLVQYPDYMFATEIRQRLRDLP